MPVMACCCGSTCDACINCINFFGEDGLVTCEWPFTISGMTLCTGKKLFLFGGSGKYIKITSTDINFSAVAGFGDTDDPECGRAYFGTIAVDLYGADDILIASGTPTLQILFDLAADEDDVTLYVFGFVSILGSIAGTTVALSNDFGSDAITTCIGTFDLTWGDPTDRPTPPTGCSDPANTDAFMFGGTITVTIDHK